MIVSGANRRSSPRFPKARRGSMAALAMLALGCAGSGLPGKSGNRVPAAPPASPAAARVARCAARILKSLKHTAYSHRTRVDEAHGKYELDCSGLAVLLLRRAAPACLRAVPCAPGKPRPRAREFEQTFAAAPAAPPDSGRAQPAWLRIESLLDARPGDFIAWRFPRQKRRGDTGHIMLVWRRPVREPSGLVRVRVLDSTRQPHARDSRRRRAAGGIGVGTIWLSIDSIGRPTGFFWRNPRGKPRRLPMAIGRPWAAAPPTPAPPDPGPGQTEAP